MDLSNAPAPAIDFALTPRASAFLTEVVRTADARADAGLRLQMQSHGWAGLACSYAVQAAPGPGERALQLGELRLFLSETSLVLLRDVLIDCSDTFGQRALRFLDLRLLQRALPSHTALYEEARQP
jgi:Fe-S cluster assembly iron-binding protein IscA